MTQRSLFWDGTALGDCGPYTSAQLMDRFYRAIINGTGDNGVLKNWNNELEVSGTTSPVVIDTGAAVVYGMFYENDAATSITIPTPASGTRTDLIVARRSWAANQVRIARVAGPGAVLTQTVGVIYEIPLASVLITSTGAITVTDTRAFVGFTTEWPANTVTTAMYEAGCITADKIPNRARWNGKGSGQFRDDGASPVTWAVSGAGYDCWWFYDAATTYGWAHFMETYDNTGAVSFYVWSVPDTNGAGGGAENCRWLYDIYYGPGDGTALATINGTVDVDQQLRVNTRAYRDLLASLTVTEGNILVIRLGRNGVADSYNHDMRFLGIETYWTADA